MQLFYQPPHVLHAGLKLRILQTLRKVRDELIEQKVRGLAHFDVMNVGVVFSEERKGIAAERDREPRKQLRSAQGKETNVKRVHMNQSRPKAERIQIALA